MTHELVDISLLNLPDLEPYLSELKYPKSKNTDFRFLPERSNFSVLDK